MLRRVDVLEAGPCIRIQRPDETFPMALIPPDTVAVLKWKVHLCTAVPLEDFDLVFDGRTVFDCFKTSGRLEDDKRLVEYEIEAEDVVDMNIHAHGRRGN